MFSNELLIIESRLPAIENHIADDSELQVVLAAARSGDKLSLDQIWCLLNIDVVRQREAFKSVLRLSRESKSAAYLGRVFAVVPLYVTSICLEHCIYCNYRSDNSSHEVERARLTLDELEQETRFLIEDKGLRAIELVYASDPAVRVSEICEHIRLVRRLVDEAGGGVVGLNAEPFDCADYTEFRQAGLDFSVLWQETYQHEVYRHSHPGGSKKSDFGYRVDSFDRMIRGGVERVALGVLSGLAPWQLDWLLLIAHGRYLDETYGVPPSVFGVPRLKPATGAQLQWAPFIPTDEEYLLAIAVHTIVSPQSMPFVNTREAWDLCTQAASGGGALFTFDCKTIPGGYTMGKVGCQFPTFSYDARTYRHRLLATGLEPIFEWTFDNLLAER